MNDRLHVHIFGAMALGGGVGLALNLAATSGVLERSTVLQVAAGGEWLGKVFLALLSMVVVPLVFSSLVAAVTQLGQDEGLARLGSRTIGYYLATSVLAIATGLVLVQILRPGQGVDYATLAAAAQAELAVQNAAVPETPTTASAGGLIVDVLYRMVPSNVVKATSDNRSMLSVIFFALLFGVFTVRVGGEQGDLLARFFDAVQAVMMKLTEAILRTAPLGIGGYVFFVTASTGLALAGALGRYLLTVALGLAIHGLITLPLLLRWLGGRSPLAYARDLQQVLLTAFSTASSSGTLPLTLRETRAAGIPERVGAFTLPLGATINMDGTALYEVVAVLFIADMLGEPTVAEQGIIAFTALLASIGAAGIPHAGVVMMVVVLQAVGLPTDAVLVILAVDRVLDMARTTVNVWSDCVGAAILARFEPAGAAASAGQ